MSTFALQETFPDAQITGLDLSPYFLAVAKYRAEEVRGEERGGRREEKGDFLPTTNNQKPTTSSSHTSHPTPHTLHPHWLHAAAESTGLTRCLIRSGFCVFVVS